MSATAVRTRLWVDGEVKTENFPLSDVSEYLNQPGALVWADLCNPDERLLSELADELGLDERAVEDVVEHSERTKATRYADDTVVTVYAMALGPQVPGSIEWAAGRSTSTDGGFIDPVARHVGAVRRHLQLEHQCGPPDRCGQCRRRSVLA